MHPSIETPASEEISATVQEQVVGQDLGIIWNHVTISRDQTGSSVLKRELLLILQASLNEVLDVSVAPKADPGSIGHLDSKKPVMYLFRAPYTQSSAWAQILKSHPVQSQTACSDTSAAMSSNCTGSIATLKAELSSDSQESASGRSRSSTDLDHTAIDTIDGSESSARLLDWISMLESENRSLREPKPIDIDIGHETVYFVHDERSTIPLAYQDEPTWVVGPRGEIVLKAHFPIPDVEAYLEQRRDVAFLVGKFYSLHVQEKDIKRAAREKKTLSPPKPSDETIRLESADMKDAMEASLATISSLEKDTDEFDSSAPISASYLFWYHIKSKEAFNGLSGLHRKHVEKLTEWIDRNYGELSLVKRLYFFQNKEMRWF